jgi:hypothetical protein
MLITVKVVPRAKEEKIVVENDRLKVYVKAEPSGGKANKRVVELIASYYGVAKTCVKIVRGFTSREKVIEISEVKES